MREHNKRRSSGAYIFLLSASAFLWWCGLPLNAALADTATTTIFISVCGNAVVESNETCDDGVNSGLYGSSTAQRTCLATCLGFGPYCGDVILQTSQLETCDDGNNSSNDGCAGDCRAEPAPPPPPPPSGGPFGGGSTITPNPTTVVVEGKAYPNADVHILKDGATVGIVKADPKADFFFSTTDVTPGTATLGFWAEDAGKLKSIAYTVTLKVTANAVTTVSGVYLPPTITLDKRKVSKGETLNISGSTIPQANIFTHVQSEETIVEAKSDNGGRWLLPFNTAALVEDDFHTAKARFRTLLKGNTIESVFSQTVSFFVGEGEIEATDFCTRADINRSNEVNLVDFSILLFNFGATGGDSDINIDGKVNLTDFSIMLFCWTG